MGLCKDLFVIEDGNLLGSCIEQHSGSGVADALCDSNVDTVHMLDECCDVSRNDNTGYVSSGTVAEMDDEKCGVDFASLELSENECGVRGVVLNESPDETDRLCLEKGGSPNQDDLRKLSEGSELPSVLTSRNGSLENSVRDDELKDDKLTTTGSFVEGVVEFKEEKKSDVFCDTLEQILSSQGCEMPSELMILNGLLSNCSEQEKQDTERVSCLSLERGVEVVDGKYDLSTETESDICYYMAHSQGAEIPLEVLSISNLVDNCDLENNLKNGPSVSQLSAEAIADVLETKCGITRGFETFSSQGCQTIMENSHMVYSASNCTQQDDQRNDDIVNDPAAEIVTEVLEEKNDVMIHKMFNSFSQMVPVEGNASNAKEDSLEIGSGSIVEDLASLQPYGINDNGSSTSLDVPELSENDVIIPRSSGESNSMWDVQTINTAKKCRNTAKVLNPCGSTKVLSRDARRKRSCIFKPARSSIWGLLENIVQDFKQSTSLGTNQVQKKGSKQAKGGRGRRKQNKNLADRGVEATRGRCTTSSSRVRLKVTLGKQVFHPEVVYGSPPANAITKDCGTEAEGNLDSKVTDGIEEKLGDEGNKEPGNAKTLPDASVLDVHLSSNDAESTVFFDKSDGVPAGDYLEIPSHMAADSSGYENHCRDPGTSPDSEVINLISEVQVIARHQEDTNSAALPVKEIAAPVDFTYRRRKKKDKNSQGSKCTLEDKSTGPAGANKAKPSNKCERRQEMEDASYSTVTLTSSTFTNASSISSSTKEPSTHFCLSSETEHGVSGEALTVHCGIEAKADCSHVDLGLSESQDPDDLCTSTKTKVHKLSKSLKSGGGNKGCSKVSASRGSFCRDREQPQKSINKRKGKGKGARDTVACNVENHLETGNHIVSDNEKTKTGDNIASVDVSNLDMVPAGVMQQNLPPLQAWVCCDDCHKWRRIPAMLVESIGSNCRWICKDSTDKDFPDCSIPQEKSNAEINADLELSDESCEEDASDASLNYKKLDSVYSKVHQPAYFTSIPANEFLHRNRKTQTIDEIMVCYCKPDPNGRLGCGDECLNRLLNIECVQGTCPCGELCSNQQFQKHDYAKLNWFRSGKKGYGLQLLQDISKGQFLIEYVGEVLDMHAYEARQKMYASDGHKHFYFMTLNGGEVIDACAKGNLGRFINHSCDPNCRTEKWMVNGEICIGLFALRDIKKGEELTFDYNYVRVFGAAAKRCYCGSAQCQGYIGGNPLNSEEIVHGESDEEFPEPVMLSIDGEIGDVLDNVVSRTSPFDVTEVQTTKSVLKDQMDESTTAVGRLLITTEVEDSINRSASVISQRHSSLGLEDSNGKYTSSVELAEISLQTEDITSKPMPMKQEISMGEDTINKTRSSSQSLEASSSSMKPRKLSSDGTEANRKSQSDSVDKKVSSKSHPRMKTSRSSTILRKGKVNVPPPSNKPSMGNRATTLSMKTKRLVEGFAEGRFEGVEEKLNELLDVDGGVSRRKDAPKGYLKLLLLTAASGDGFNGEAIQSNRDLSMILDALLKTKSRSVLIDIINKNGLQMLHKMMKKYRRDFKKIPILRKLLKVLEYLALREILTLEHINGGPLCPGMESFRESILSFTEHDDKQVHQIARNFRDRWIPRHARKISYMDKDDGRMELSNGANYKRLSVLHNHGHDHGRRLTEAVDSVQQSIVTTNPPDTGARDGSSAPCTGSPTNGIKKRKFISRWDQPARSKPQSRSIQHNEPTTNSGQSESSPLMGRGEMVLDHSEMVSREQKKIYGSDNSHCQKNEATTSPDESHLEDAPPGFSSPISRSRQSTSLSTVADLPPEYTCHLKYPDDVVIGHPRERFISRLPVSYGIPLSIVHEFGTRPEENVDNWLVAPGIPFQPFPPLPPCPRGKTWPPHFANPVTMNQPAGVQRDDHSTAAPYSDQRTPRVSGAKQPNIDNPGTSNQHMDQRLRGSSYDLGKRYFRQQKWNTPKVPPWLWKRTGWGIPPGNNSRSGIGNVGVGNIETEVNNLCSPNLGYRVENNGNSFYRHHNQH